MNKQLLKSLLESDDWVDEKISEGWNLESFYEYFMDDRSHGDDFIADASKRIWASMNDETKRANMKNRDFIVNFVRQVEGE